GSPEALPLHVRPFRQEWTDEFLPAPHRAGVGILAREPVGNRFLTGKIRPGQRFPPGDIRHHWPGSMVAGRVAAAERLSILTKPSRTRTQAALRFVLAFPGASVAIPGAKTVEQVEANVAAADAPALTEDDIREARALNAKDFGL